MIQFLKFCLCRRTKAVILHTYYRAEFNFEKRFRTRLTAHLVHLSGVASGRIFAIFLSSTVSAVGCNRRLGTFEGKLQSRI